MFLAKLKTAAVLLAALSCASAWMIASVAGPAPAPPAQEPPAGEVAQTKPQDRGLEVPVETVRRSKWGRTTSQPATVASYGTVDVYPRISGYLRVIPVEIGQMVKYGQILAQIDDPGLAVAVQRARAEVERGKARVKKAGAGVRVAQAAADLEHSRVEAATADVASSRAWRDFRDKQLHRIGDLVRRNAVEQRLEDEAKGEFEKATAAAYTAKAQLKVAQAAEEEAKARVQMAEAEMTETIGERQVAEAGLREAQIREGYARIVAPFDGVVTRVNYHDGALVGPPDQGKVEPILTVVRSDIMRVGVSVPEAHVPFLDQGDPATIRIRALGERGVFQGSITHMAYALTGQSLHAEIVLANKDGRLRPGQSGLAEIQLETRENALTIPTSCLLTGDRPRSRCFCVRGGRAVIVEITIGASDQHRAEILEGLKEGDMVITRWVHSYQNGMAVTPHPEKDGMTPAGK